MSVALPPALVPVGRAPDPDVLGLARDLAESRLGRGVRKDAADACTAIAEHGLWTLGAPESAGGGGADPVTTAHTIAIFAAAWPMVALACAHAHAATTGLGACAGAEPDAVHAGRAIAVVDAVNGRTALSQDNGRLRLRCLRVDMVGEADLLVALPDCVALLPAEEVSYSERRRTSGLAGARTVAAEAWIDDHHRGGDAATSEEVRLVLAAGIAAVAAGIATAAGSYAAEYSGGRLQFGAPLTAIPSVREALLDQQDNAMTALALATAAATAPHDRIAAHHAVECAIASSVHAVQALGGYGYLADHPVEECLRDALSLRAATDLSHQRAAAGDTWLNS